MENFLINFKEQLEDPSINLTAKTDYVNSDFWDSLTAVTVHMMIEEKYGLKIEIKDLSNFKSIEELYTYILNKK